MTEQKGNVKPANYNIFLDSVLDAKYLHQKNIEETILAFEINNMNMTPIEAYFHICFETFKDICFQCDPPISIPQKKIPPYKVDFWINYENKYLIVECDGHDYHEKTKKQAKHDKKRDRYLTSLGCIVFRFTGSELYKDPFWCVSEIFEYLQESQGDEHLSKESLYDLLLDSYKKANNKNWSR